MEKIFGKYQHVKNENTDQYFTAVGVPYLIRKMMSVSSPTLEIIKDGEHWIVRNSSLMKNLEQRFLLGVEYQEEMPNGETMKSISTLDSKNNLVTKSVIDQSGIKTSRYYEFGETSCVVNLEHEKSDVTAKRYFSRLN